jgi:hypothetical protein
MFQLQVKTVDPSTGCERWEPVRPAGRHSTPYRWETWESAREALVVWYGTVHPESVRVVEVLR